MGGVVLIHSLLSIIIFLHKYSLFLPQNSSLPLRNNFVRFDLYTNIDSFSPIFMSISKLTITVNEQYTSFITIIIIIVVVVVVQISHKLMKCCLCCVIDLMINN